MHLPRSFASIVSFAALALLAACGGSSAPGNVNAQGLYLGPPDSLTVYVSVVPVGFWADDRHGEYREEGPNGFVRIRADMMLNSTLARRTLMHELGHAAGLDHMGGDCVMNIDAGGAPNLDTCPVEEAQVQAMTFTLTVYVSPDPQLHAETLGACTRWNNEGGRMVFAVQ